MLRLAKLSTAIWMLGCSTRVILALQNVTIDDRFGDELTHIVPTFTPVDGWWLGSAGGTGGFAKPSASLAYNKTWLDSTHNVGEVERMVNFGFTGVSLYVYCIIANSQDFSAFADYRFLMDGELVGAYTHYVEKPSGYLYNTPVYVNKTLKNEFHNFSIVVDSIEQPVLLLFDYAIYTATDDLVNQPSSRFPIPTPIPPSDVGADIGRTLGAFTLGLFLGMLLLVVYRRQKTQGISGWRLANVRATTRRWVPDFRKNIATIVEATHQSRLSLAIDASTQAPAHGRRDLDTRDRSEEELREIRREVQNLRAEQRTMIMAISMPRSPPPYNA